MKNKFKQIYNSNDGYWRGKSKASGSTKEEAEKWLMQVSISSITIPPWDKPPGHDLKGAKPSPRTIIVYKNPPLGTEKGVKSPTPGT